MRDMKRPANVSFLSKDENACLELLLQAQDLFDKLCTEEPQNSKDAYNFGHYLDAAMTSLVIRGCRRLDPDNLMPKYADTWSTSEVVFDEIIARISNRRHAQIRRHNDESADGN